MSLASIDNLETAWELFERAETLVSENQEYGAVLSCENGLEKLYSAARKQGEDKWFARKQKELRSVIANLKASSKPESEEVSELIEGSRELAIETKQKVQDELKQRNTDESEVPNISF